MVTIVREIRTVDPAVPILVHANAGMPLYENGQTLFPETPAIMASHVEALLEAGVNILGGCCGTSPEHIKAIKEIINVKNTPK